MKYEDILSELEVKFKLLLILILIILIYINNSYCFLGFNERNRKRFARIKI